MGGHNRLHNSVFPGGIPCPFAEIGRYGQKSSKLDAWAELLMERVVLASYFTSFFEANRRIPNGRLQVLRCSAPHKIAKYYDNFVLLACHVAGKFVFHYTDFPLYALKHHIFYNLFSNLSVFIPVLHKMLRNKKNTLLTTLILTNRRNICYLHDALV